MGNSKRQAELKNEAMLREARRAARRAKRAQRSTAPRAQVDIGPMTSLRMVLRCAKVDGYLTLKRSITLRDYVAKFRYHEHIQKATMTGEFTVELPFKLAVDVERELSPHWTRGKMDGGAG